VRRQAARLALSSAQTHNTQGEQSLKLTSNYETMTLPQLQLYKHIATSKTDRDMILELIKQKEAKKK